MPPDDFLNRDDVRDGEVPNLSSLNVEGGAFLAIEGDVPELDRLLHADDADLIAHDIPTEGRRGRPQPTRPRSCWRLRLMPVRRR